MPRRRAPKAPPEEADTTAPVIPSRRSSRRADAREAGDPEPPAEPAAAPASSSEVSGSHHDAAADSAVQPPAVPSSSLEIPARVFSECFSLTMASLAEMQVSINDTHAHNAVVNQLKKSCECLFWLPTLCCQALRCAVSEAGRFDVEAASTEVTRRLVENAFGGDQNAAIFEALIADPTDVVVEAAAGLAAGSSGGDIRRLRVWWSHTHPRAFWQVWSSRVVKSTHEIRFDAEDPDVAKNVDTLIRSVAVRELFSSTADRVSPYLLLSEQGDVVVLQRSWLLHCPRVSQDDSSDGYGSASGPRARIPSFRVIQPMEPGAAKGDLGGIPVTRIGSLSELKRHLAWMLGLVGAMCFTLQLPVFSVLGAFWSILLGLFDFIVVPVPLSPDSALVVPLWTVVAGALLVALALTLAPLSPASLFFAFSLRHHFQWEALRRWARGRLVREVLSAAATGVAESIQQTPVVTLGSTFVLVFLSLIQLLHGVCLRVPSLGSDCTAQSLPVALVATSLFHIALWLVCRKPLHPPLRAPNLPVTQDALRDSSAWDSNIVWRRVNFFWSRPPPLLDVCASLKQKLVDAQNQVISARSALDAHFESRMRVLISKGRGVGSLDSEVRSVLESAVNRIRDAYQLDQRLRELQSGAMPPQGREWQEGLLEATVAFLEIQPSDAAFRVRDRRADVSKEWEKVREQLETMEHDLEQKILDAQSTLDSMHQLELRMGSIVWDAGERVFDPDSPLEDDSESDLSLADRKRIAGITLEQRIVHNAPDLPGYCALEIPKTTDSKLLTEWLKTLRGAVGYNPPHASLDLVITLPKLRPMIPRHSKWLGLPMFVLPDTVTSQVPSIPLLLSPQWQRIIRAASFSPRTCMPRPVPSEAEAPVKTPLLIKSVSRLFQAAKDSWIVADGWLHSGSSPAARYSSIALRAIGRALRLVCTPWARVWDRVQERVAQLDLEELLIRLKVQDASTVSLRPSNAVEVLAQGPGSFASLSYKALSELEPILPSHLVAGSWSVYFAQRLRGLWGLAAVLATTSILGFALTLFAGYSTVWFGSTVPATRFFGELSLLPLGAGVRALLHRMGAPVEPSMADIGQLRLGVLRVAAIGFWALCFSMVRHASSLFCWRQPTPSRKPKPALSFLQRTWRSVEKQLPLLFPLFGIALVGKVVAIVIGVPAGLAYSWIVFGAFVPIAMLAFVPRDAMSPRQRAILVAMVPPGVVLVLLLIASTVDPCELLGSQCQIAFPWSLGLMLSLVNTVIGAAFLVTLQQHPAPEPRAEGHPEVLARMSKAHRLASQAKATLDESATQLPRWLAHVPLAGAVRDALVSATLCVDTLSVVALLRISALSILSCGVRVVDAWVWRPDMLSSTVHDWCGIALPPGWFLFALLGSAFARLLPPGGTKLLAVFLCVFMSGVHIE
jgi:hypothetical protein